MDQAENLRKIFAGQKSENARIITVASGKGGVGKTSFTVNFALSLLHQGLRVAIIDADFGFQNVDIILGVSAKHSMSQVLSREMTLSQVMQTCHGGLKYISGGHGTMDLINITPEKMEILGDQLLEFEKETDIILFDTGAGMPAASMKLIQASDETILLMTPEPTSIMDAYVIIKTVASIIPQPRVKLVINRAASVASADQTYKNFCNVANKYLQYTLEYLGCITNDDNVTRAIINLTPLVIKYPNSTASRQIMEIAKKYNGTSVQTEPIGIRGFFKNLLGRRN